MLLMPTAASSSQAHSQADIFTRTGNSQEAKQSSLPDNDIVSKRIVYVHVDVEDGGPYCVLLQISVVVVNTDFSK